MAREYSDDERAAILAKSFELLSRDVRDTRQVSEPEMDRDEMLRQELARPTETRNQRCRREIEERNAMWAAKRATAEAENLEAQLARERDAIYRALGEVLAREIAEPMRNDLPSWKICAIAAILFRYKAPPSIGLAN